MRAPCPLRALPQDHRKMNSDANVDLTEIAKFEAIASRWWDMEGEFKPLHQINPVRLDWITDKSGGLFGKRVLDRSEEHTSELQSHA